MFGRERVSRRPRLERLWREHLSWSELPLWAALVPLSAVYAMAVGLRSLAWRLLRRERRFPFRVISVGNLTVGGAGKTPFTLYLARKLSERGLATAIVSRGFGGSKGSGRALLVSDRGELKVTAEEAGDEPAMMAKSFDGPIAIARHRIGALEMLEQRGGLDVVILDDGFQHIRLPRDLDLLVVNGSRGLGNGWMLPAGPMREGLGAACRADAVIMLGTARNPRDHLTARQTARLSRQRVFHGTIRPRALVQAERGAWHEMPINLAGRQVLALSGLADPAGFRETLLELEAELVGVLEYPDHHRYTAADWHTITAAARDADMIITTEKDLVKLERFPFPRDSLYALRLEISMGPDEERLLEFARSAAPGPARALRA